MAPHDHPPPRPRHRLNPDPIRASPSRNMAGCGPHGSYRHVHHQRGTIGTFHVRLLEGRGLERRHWSVMSLGPARHLGLSRAHGEVSSFGTMRLAFWGDGNVEEEVEFEDVHGAFGPEGSHKGLEDYSSGYTPLSSAVAAASSTASSSATSSAAPSRASSQGDARYDSFLPSMTATSQLPSADDFGTKGKAEYEPLTPLFDQGCLRSATPSRSPYFPSYATPQRKQPLGTINSGEAQKVPPPPSASGLSPDWDKKPAAARPPQKSMEKMPTEFRQQSSGLRGQVGPPPPHHYAKEEFKSSTVHNDSNPIWGDASSFIDGNNDDGENRSAFRIPLRKDDLLPSLHRDGGKVGLEVRLDEEMAPTESLLVGGALSTAVGAATAATSVVGMGSLAQNVSNSATEMLGLGKDRLIGKGFVDLMPLLLGLWEEEWEQRQDEGSSHGGAGKGRPEDDDMVLDAQGKVKASAKRMRRRVERMGLLDVWVPLYHPNSAASSGKDEREDEGEEVPTSGKIHLLISYEPNGMAPKRDDIVAFESFARRPLGGAHDSSANMGPVLAPLVPPLSPLLVIESRGAYLLLEYAASRTVTSVDRNGNVKSSRWERTHRVRIRRTAVFVVERRTLMDAAGSIARLPGDIVLSTPIGQEIAEASAPIVAGAMELMGPALLWGKLMVAAGGTGVKAGMVGLQAATSAVVAASQEKALERREGEAGAYGYGG